MADNSSKSNSIAQSNNVFDFSLRSPNLDEIEDLLFRYVRRHKLNTTSRVRDVDSKLNVHGQGDFAVFTVGYGADLTVHMYPGDANDRVAFVMAGSGAGQLAMSGQEYALTAEKGVVFPSGPEVFLRYGSSCETLAVVLNTHRLAEQCGKLLGYEIEQPLEFDRRFSLESSAGQSWMRLVRYAADELSKPLSLTRQIPAVAQQLESMVGIALLLGHSHTYSDALLRPRSAAAPYYVKRAEAYIEAHFAEPLSLADIAAQAGVSARSLQNGFQSFRHMTPMAFLRQVRLRRAQEALVRADPAFATVTEIALRCGFSHMGEFASLYKRAFGETPRQTLSRTVHR